eukprot:1596373-Rhodomonas_salina.1
MRVQEDSDREFAQVGKVALELAGTTLQQVPLGVCAPLHACLFALASSQLPFRITSAYRGRRLSADARGAGVGGGERVVRGGGGGGGGGELARARCRPPGRPRGCPRHGLRPSPPLDPHALLRHQPLLHPLPCRRRLLCFLCFLFAPPPPRVLRLTGYGGRWCTGRCGTGG